MKFYFCLRVFHSDSWMFVTMKRSSYDALLTTPSEKES